MNESVKPFDANDALKSVKDRMKDSFVTLIPDEQWEQMIKKEIDSYFQAESIDSYNRKYISKFSEDVHVLLQQEAQGRVKKYMNENFQAAWDCRGNEICGKIVKEIILNNSGELLKNMIGGIIHNAFASAGYQIR